MDLRSAARNHHFVSQAEQRLNAINPSARKDKQRIYAFKLEDRESHLVRLDSPQGLKINNSLVFHDLFSFDVLGQEKQRCNFEKLFGQYESDIQENTRSLLNKLPDARSDIKSEVLNIFVLKFLNFVRNPHSVQKVLNTFPQLISLCPTDPTHLGNLQRVLHGVKPQQKHLCQKLGISEKEYTEWLTVIFMLLTRFEGATELNFLESAVRGLCRSPNTYKRIIIYTYDTQACLLSDRGYSIPLPEGKHLAFDFNLCSNAFIRYVFADIDELAPRNAPPVLIERFKARSPEIDVNTFINDLDALAKYNRNVVYQCASTVFNSSTECYGVNQVESMSTA